MTANCKAAGSQYSAICEEPQCPERCRSELSVIHTALAPMGGKTQDSCLVIDTRPRNRDDEFDQANATISSHEQSNAFEGSPI